VDNNQKGILGKPKYTFRKKLTPKELDEHWAQNLCYFCHEKYSPGHDCPQRKKTQVFFMEVEDQDLEDDPPELVPEAHPGVSPPTVSFNALHGESQNAMMRMTGWLGKKENLCVN